MMHVLKSSAMASRHLIKARKETAQTQTGTFQASISTQTELGHLEQPGSKLEESETLRLASEALRAANRTQRRLTEFMREAVCRLQLYSTEESTYFEGMASQMNNFADDFEELTKMAENQSNDIKSLNKTLTDLNQRYQQDFPDERMEWTPEQASSEQINNLPPKPAHKNIVTTINRERRELTPPPPHGRLETTSFFKRQSKKGKSKQKKKKVKAVIHSITSPSKVTTNVADGTLNHSADQAPGNPLKLVIRRK